MHTSWIQSFLPLASTLLINWHFCKFLEMPNSPSEWRCRLRPKAVRTVRATGASALLCLEAQESESRVPAVTPSHLLFTWQDCLLLSPKALPQGASATWLPTQETCKQLYPAASPLSLKSGSCLILKLDICLWITKKEQEGGGGWASSDG